MAAAPTISFGFPCYNDEPTIGALVLTAHRALAGHDHEIIVVDDGSTDGSRALLARLESRLEGALRVVLHDTNRGYGGAIRAIFANARGEWVGYTDGDGQYDPAEISRFLPLLTDQYDWVQGFKGDRSDDVVRRVVGDVYRRGLRAAFGIRIQDVDCDFRFVRRAVLESVRLERSSGAICPELATGLELASARVTEVQVTHHPRIYGESQFFRVDRVARTLLDLGVLFGEVAGRRWATREMRHALRDARADASRRAYAARVAATAEEALRDAPTTPEEKRP